MSPLLPAVDGNALQTQVADSPEDPRQRDLVFRTALFRHEAPVAGTGPQTVLRVTHHRVYTEKPNSSNNASRFTTRNASREISNVLAKFMIPLMSRTELRVPLMRSW